MTRLLYDGDRVCLKTDRREIFEVRDIGGNGPLDATWVSGRHKGTYAGRISPGFMSQAYSMDEYEILPRAEENKPQLGALDYLNALTGDTSAEG